MSVLSVVLRLLAEGVVSGESKDIIGPVNELLRPIQYEAVGWPDGSCIVLKDCRGLCPVDAGAKEAEEVFRSVAMGIHVQGDTLDMLIRDGWAEEVGEELRLSKRSLVQHADFILTLGGRYVLCGVCGFLSDGERTHSFCRALLEGERNGGGGEGVG